MGKTGDLSNPEIVTLVVYLLGGATNPIHAEDVAIQANQVAPRRFLWRKYPQQINLQGVRFALEDAKKPQYRYLIGSANEDWMLTEVGCKFAERNVDRLTSVDLSAERKSDVQKNWAKRERKRMLASEAYEKLQCGQIDAITALEAASFFRVDEYVTGQLRERKLLRIINEFGNDPELGGAVMALAARVREDNQNE